MKVSKFLVVLLVSCLIFIVGLSGSGFAFVKLTASDGQSLDRLGESVSISNDYAIIGAAASINNDKPGSAYIFKRSGNTWIQQVKLIASDAKNHDDFGASVSISGDHAIIGSILGAYIFKYNGNIWAEEVKLTGGKAVSISGDYAIASHYIFKYDGNNWIQQTKLVGDDEWYSDGFGCSVYLDGDYTIVGADGDDDKGTNMGAAYIFKRDGAAWSQQAKLIPNDGLTGDAFGISVSLSGDYAIIGTPQNAGGNSTGAAYIFKREGTAWLQKAKLTPSNPKVGAIFGWSVSVSGDYAITGARGNETGYAYIFKKPASGWANMTETFKLNNAASNEFGESVAIYGSHAIIGAITDAEKGVAAGAAFIYPDIAEQCAIAGHIRDKDNNPISGATVTFGNDGGSTTTDGSGYYSHVVYKGWSGTVTVSKSGYIFKSTDIGPVSSNTTITTPILGTPQKTGMSASKYVKTTNWNTNYTHQQKKTLSIWGKVYGRSH